MNSTVTCAGSGALTRLLYLDAWLTYLGTSRKELARTADVGYVTLYYAIHGQHRMREDLVARVAEALNLPSPILLHYLPTDPGVTLWSEKAVQAAADQQL